MAKSSSGHLLKEARRRGNFRLAGLYIVGAWVLVQIALAVFPALGIPEEAIGYVWLAAIAGFPLAMVLGWRYDIVGGRVVRTVSTDENADLSIGRSDYLVLGALTIVAVFVVSGLVRGLMESRGPLPEVEEVTATPVRPNSIAVLAFENMSSDPENEYFADGLSEEILNLLARVRGLRVTSRSSAFSFKGQNVDIPTIGERLQVAHILEGSVRVSGDQIRITAQLIDVDNDIHLWSQTYDREIDDIFEIQDEVAAAVTEALQVTLLANEGRSRETNSEAYELYLRGRYMLDFDLDKAERLMSQALALDPGYAPAWLGRASVHFHRATRGAYETEFPLVREAAEKALEVDPRYASAYATLATVAYQHEWDFVAAAGYIGKALELEPGNEGIYHTAALLEATLGNFDKAIDYARSRLDIYPIRGHALLGRTLMYAGRFDEAERELRQQLANTPDNANPFLHLTFLQLARGTPELALADLELLAERPGATDNPWYQYMMTIVLYALGDVAQAESAWALAREILPEDVAPYQYAGVCALRGDADCAFRYLDQAYEIRDNGLIHLLSDPLLGNLRDDPRWNEVLERIGLPKDKLARLHAN